MKKIIDGKKYDTDTAKAMATASASLPVNDFGYFEETLYKKKTGEFFLCGRGGPATKYARRCSDGSRCGGDGIIPIDDAWARDWVERFANDEFEKIFGECEE